MKHLKAYLDDIPRYQQAKIKEKKRYQFADYKTFIVTPECPPPKMKKVFMVKAKEVFLAQRKDFFKSLMSDLFQKNILQEWDAKLFSEVYLNLHLGKNARIIASPQKAARYKAEMRAMKWFLPKNTIEKSGLRFEFFAIDFEFNEVHKYNILVKEDGSIATKISPNSSRCPIISESKIN